MSEFSMREEIDVHTNKLSPRYVGMFDRGYGREAIEIKLDYPFEGSGVLVPPTIAVNIDLGKKSPPYYMEVICIVAHSQSEAAKSWGIKQQDLSDCLARHKEVQKRLGRGL